jgi:hypothetical protein
MRTFWSFSGAFESKDKALSKPKVEREALQVEDKKLYWERVRQEEEEYRKKNFPNS